MIKNVQQKCANKILDMYYYLISGAILLFVLITICDLGTSSIRFIYVEVFQYIVLHHN